MFRKSKNLKILALLMLSFFSLEACAQLNTALYKSVLSKEKWSFGESISIEAPDSNIKNYLVDSDDLYLLIQVTRSGWFSTKIENKNWTETELESLRNDLKIRKFFPNPDSVDGGVSWIFEE